MSKIKDTIELEKEFSNKELEAIEPNKYMFDEVNHIHTFNNKPLLGTSTVVGVIAKPLTWWASGLAMAKLGWINSKKMVDGKYKTIKLEDRLASAGVMLEKLKNMSVESYLALLDEGYKAHSVKLSDSASDGTDLHAELESYVKYHMGIWEAKNFSDRIMPFINWVEQNVDEFLWSEMHCYSDKLWVGGISDVGVKLKNGQIGIIDFKSSKESYESQFIQCSGYDIQITENGGYTWDGKKIFSLEKPIEFYAIIPFGAEKFTVDFRYNVDELKEAFKGALTIYKILNK